MQATREQLQALFRGWAQNLSAWGRAKPAGSPDDYREFWDHWKTYEMRLDAFTIVQEDEQFVENWIRDLREAAALAGYMRPTDEGRLGQGEQ